MGCSTRPRCDLVADWADSLVRPGEFAGSAPAAAKDERSSTVMEDVSAGVGPGPGQEEAVDPASGQSGDPLSASVSRNWYCFAIPVQEWKPLASTVEKLRKL